MCIIVVKNENVGAPTWRTLETCFNANPDGAGFMTIENGKVVIHKGFMSFGALKKALNESYRRTGKRAPYVYHFRIGTQGGNIPQNCHPFPVASEYRFLTALHIKTDVAIAHNGIISSCCDYASKYSDTQIFVKEYLSKLITTPKYHKDARLAEIIGDMIGSKMAILGNDGFISLIGKFEEENGIYYSNTSYKPRVIYTWKGNTSATAKESASGYGKYFMSNSCYNADGDCSRCVIQEYCY